MGASTTSWRPLALAAVGALALLPCRSDADEIPATMRQCEQQLCERGGGGTWTFNGRAGKARWTVGVQADLTVERYENGEVVIRRVDVANGPTRGATAIYRGTVRGNRIEGTVDYNWPGHFNNGKMTTTWYAVIGEWAPGLEPTPASGGPARTSSPGAAASTAPAPPAAKAPAQEAPLVLQPLPALPKAAVADAVRRADQFFAAQNYVAAAPLYRQAAEAGDAHAQVRLNFLFLNGLGVPKHCGEALRWLHIAEEAGDADAARALGGSYQQGLCVAKDQLTALRWWRKSAERGNAGAMNSVGLSYWYGRGIPRDFPEALKWFRRAGEHGNGEGARNVADYYLHNRPVDITQVRPWLDRAIGLGDAQAMTRMGQLYERGEIVPQDLHQAFDWYRKAAALNDAAARLKLHVFSAVGYSSGDKWVGSPAPGGPVLFDLAGDWDGYFEGGGTPFVFRIYQAGDRIVTERLSDSLQPIGRLGFRGGYDSRTRAGSVDVPKFDDLEQLQASLFGNVRIDPKKWAPETLTILDPDHIKIGNRQPLQRLQDPDAFDVPCDAGNSFHVQANYAALRGRTAGNYGADDVAVCWFRVAAAQGHARAISELGRRLYFGQGAPRNVDEGLALLRKGAELGDYYGCAILALLYEQGDGLPADKVQADAWRAKANAIKAQEERAARDAKIREAKEELELRALAGMARAAAIDNLRQMSRDTRCFLGPADTRYRNAINEGVDCD